MDPEASDGPDLTGIVVAIDGPAGSGKSSLAQRLAEVSGLPHIDTGALYRAAALACVRAGIELGDAAACARVVQDVSIVRVDARTLLDGEDVEDEIRTDGVSAAAAVVATHPEVRELLVPAQRDAVARGGIVEGRDIGTVILPDADLKVFLTASLDERARRRAGQFDREDVEDVARDIRSRDASDGSRTASPLVPADDAWVLDTTDWELDEVVEVVHERVLEVAAERGDVRGHADPLEARRAMPRVVVVGRPNVGKSTLVNRILGERVTIVEERPGITRDRTEHQAEWSGHAFLVVDTGGWEHRAEGLGARIVEQAAIAVADADLVLMVVDATTGVLEDDERYARLLRRSGVPVLIVANKVDGDAREADVPDFLSLGLGVPTGVSARHGRGIGDLLDDVIAHLPRRAIVADGPRVPHVAIVGRPNVGKSSLFNRLLGEERSIVDAVAHTTRDPVDTMVELDGRPWVFVDTAGMRRRYRHGEDTELYAVDRTRAAIDQADLVLFVIDATEPIGDQDQRIAAMLRDAGRGIVLVVNKWDAIDEERREALDVELERELGFAAWAPRVNVSALTGRSIRRLVPLLVQVWDNYVRRIPTRELNRIIEDAVAAHTPPRIGNRPLRIRYATQAEVAPPLILLFANGAVPEPDLRFLERTVRSVHDFTGVPLTLSDRRSGGGARR